MGNLMAVLAYLFGWLGGLIVFIIAKDDKVARFHGIQSILANVVYGIIYGILVALMAVLFIIIGYIAVAVKVPALVYVGFIPLLLIPVFLLAWFILILLGMWNGWKNEIYRMPLIGSLADKWSG
jgi:uncharacterized membrane protein